MWEQWASGHQFQININPISLQFFRHTRARQQRLGANGPGFRPWEAEDLGMFTVRIHQQGSGSANVSEAFVGVQERDTTWGCIMPPEVPLRVTDGEDDSTRVFLVHPAHGSFRLRRLRALETGGKLMGWQSDLERMAHTGPVPEPVSASTATTGRKRLEDDPDHPWREIVARAEELRARGPRLPWSVIASRVGTTEERLREYRHRAAGETQKAAGLNALPEPEPAQPTRKVRTRA